MTQSKFRNYAHTLTVIFLVSTLAYFNSLKSPFQFDDVLYIQQSPYIKNFATFFNDFQITNILNRSILVFTYTVNYHLGRENTLGYHFFNLFIHFGVCLYLYLISRKMLLFYGQGDTALPLKQANIPLIAALLYAVHPVQIQSVTYIMSRSASLCTLFYLASFYCFLLVAELKNNLSPSWQKTVGVLGLVCAGVLLMVLGLGVKLIIVSLPVIILIYFFLFIKSKDDTLLDFIRKERKMLGLIILTITAFIIYKGYNFEAGTFKLRKFLKVADQSSKGFDDSVDYFFSQIKWLTFYYLKNLVFPFNLNIDPDTRTITTFPDPKLFFSGILFVIFAFYIKNRSKIAVFGLLWFIITFAPESSLIPLLDLVADHRMYLPGIGTALMTSVLLGARNRVAIHLFLIVFFALNTAHRNADWTMDTKLWKDATAKSPDKSRPHINYARTLHLQGESEGAIRNYKRAIELDPGYFEAHHNLGELYAKIGSCPEAIREFQTALVLVPTLAESMNGIGRCYKAMGDLNAAIFYFKKSAETKPEMDSAFRELGLIYYFDLKDTQAGRFYFQQAIRLNPYDPANTPLKNLLNN